MDNNKFYITTPIYYVNDKPHIGHAYTTILADVLAAYSRSNNNPTFFLTGTDEHGQKVEKAAQLHNMTPQQQCDETVVRFKELWDKLEISNDYFIRTTDSDHKKVVQDVLQELYERDEIYKAEYTGWYCVSDERFFNERDLVNGKCPECNKDVTAIKESNYFFRMSKYQDWLIDYIKNNDEFIMPPFRANETLGFLKQELSDLCISRPKSRLSWGIELPFDSEYVCYVWFDALINYISGVGYRKNDEEFKKWWPASLHLIGKDILTTHSVYWPTMLKAMNLPMPKTIFAHGWWLTGNTKMGKSLGNAVDPMTMIEAYGVDAFRYFLLAEMSPGQDASFTEDAFITRYNSDLANDLGNILSRVIKMVSRNCNGVIPSPADINEEDQKIFDIANEAIIIMQKSLEEIKPDKGLNAAMNAVRAGNRYLELMAPWTLAKKGETERLNTVLYTVADMLRKVSVLLAPVMPQKMAELRKALGYNDSEAKSITISQLNNDSDLAGRKIVDIDGLFPRIQVEKK